jgi:signal peptidase II
VPQAKVTIIPNLLDLTLVLNPGAVFGIGAGKRWFFIPFTAAALGLALWMFATWTRPRDYMAHAAIGLLISGGLGNLHDRIAFACVRDFLHPLPGAVLPFGWTMPMSGSRELWPYVSNFADLWLLVGIGMLMWYLWRTPKKQS